jgi:hypothetical protein
MCDYSLHGFASRLAIEGEELEIHRFATRSIGLASPADLYPPKPATRPSFWAAIRAWFNTSFEPQVQAVCIPPGARLIVRDIPERLRRELGVNCVEQVAFTQLTDSPYSYRDGIRFENGKEVLLQRLDEGQRVHVLRLGSGEDEPRGRGIEGEREFAYRE